MEFSPRRWSRRQRVTAASSVVALVLVAATAAVVTSRLRFGPEYCYTALGPDEESGVFPPAATTGDRNTWKVVQAKVTLPVGANAIRGAWRPNPNTSWTYSYPTPIQPPSLPGDTIDVPFEIGDGTAQFGVEAAGEPNGLVCGQHLTVEFSNTLQPVGTATDLSFLQWPGQ